MDKIHVSLAKFTLFIDNLPTDLYSGSRLSDISAIYVDCIGHLKETIDPKNVSVKFQTIRNKIEMLNAIKIF